VGRNELQFKPENVAFEKAAGVGAGAYAALHGLYNAGQVQAGQRIAVNGASGGMGTFAVQVDRALGQDVTGVCGATYLE
jgi:NADPH:quinone reductase-like Zn-dependent oxidoreductase